MSVNYITNREPAGFGESRQCEEQSWPSPPDPGDLSKRVTRRRAELQLSKAQVAARAGMSLRYLEYVERYPARPGGSALRRLAAVLQTTPAALLGARAQVPPAYGRMNRPPVIDKLMPRSGPGPATTATSTCASSRPRSPAGSRTAEPRVTTSRAT